MYVFYSLAKLSEDYKTKGELVWDKVYTCTCMCLWSIFLHCLSECAHTMYISFCCAI